MALNKCFKCGNEVSKDSVFCEKCGNVLKCQQCGNTIDDGSEFCNKCGAKLGVEVKRKSKKKIWLLIIILLLVAGAVAGYFLFLRKGKYKLDPYEAVAYTSLNLAEATSAYMGGGSITKAQFDTLGKMVKKYDSSSEWFASYYGYYSRTADTDKNKVTYLCNDNYCAKFVVEHTGGDYYLVDYLFESSSEKGYKIYVVDSKD